MDKISEHLKHPGKEYRPVPFWSWNDKLDSETIRLQIREMKKAGMGGFFMHARGGLETEYLSEEWMKAIEAGLDEAQKADMASWAYDEEGWPSGFAGGRVCALGDRYHGRWLEKEKRTLTPEDVKGFFDSPETPSVWILGIYAGEEPFSLLSKPEAEAALSAKKECLIISHNSNPYYIDVLSREVVGKFIEFTHESYLSRFPDHFDGKFQGFFTDEPRLSGRNIDEDFPWSYTLPNAYHEDYGQDLISLLPALFYPFGEFQDIRYKFWKLVNRLFAHSFVKQLGDWCRLHNSKLTGHIMMEETMSTQMPNTGGVMPFYEYMDIPGIDWLRRTMSSPVVPKQVSSVAAQTGKKQVLTESFALCGWNAGFEDLKWVAQWQYVNGVNLLCQHLEGYTIRGLRKRDYPPSLFIQQPWWDQYEHFNTYFARVGMILSEGFNPVDLLVIHPMRSGWLLFDGYQNQELKALDKRFADLLETLSGQHIEYHLGDETVLERHGSVADKKLKVGLCSYSCVLIPDTLTLASSTLDLLEQFMEQGGKVICLNSLPGLEEGRTSGRSLEGHNFLTMVEPESLIPSLSGMDRSLSLVDKATGREAVELQATCRRFEDGTFWYITNNSRTGSFSVDALVPDKRELFLYDPLDDSSRHLPSALTDGGRRIELDFEPARSLLILAKDASESHLTGKAGVEEQALELSGMWDLKLEDPNVLTLDRCRYSIDGGEWQPEMDVIHLFKLLLDRKSPCRLAMEFTFESILNRDNLTDLNLVVEMAEEFDIKVNGHKILCDGTSWWKDSSFKKTDILHALVEGTNKIVLERDFYQSDEVYRVLYGKNVYETEKNKMTYDVELESIYLTGDFSVKTGSSFTPGGNGSVITGGPFFLAPLERQTEPVNLEQKGLLFFAGKVRIDKTVSLRKNQNTKYLLKLGHPAVSMIKILINGKELTNLLWAPWEADGTELLRDGENTISFILYGSNRNMLGPHHHIDGEPFNVGPGSFTGEWSWVEKSSEAVPATDEDKKRSYWNRDYAFVPFGLEERK